MGSNKFDDSGVMELTRNIMVMSIVALFIIMIFFTFVLFFSKQRREAIEATNNCVCDQKGLDDWLLKTIRVIQFDPKSFEEGLECTVCLSELKEGEKARILPKCDHVFHIKCIDMWFLSHTTCPICRNPIVVDESEITEEERNSTVVLVVGDEDSNRECLNSEPVSSSSSSSRLGTCKNEGRSDLVIDIPAQGEGKDEEDEKSPVPCSGMRSLMRILSGSRRFNSLSPRSDTVDS